MGGFPFFCSFPLGFLKCKNKVKSQEPSKVAGLSVCL